MSNLKGHILKFKDEQGQWVDIPILVVDVYDTYVAYCKENNVTPVSATTYYGTLGKLDDYVSQLTANANNIAALTAAINSIANGEVSVVHTDRGGTGRSFEDTDALITYIYAQLKENHSVIDEDALDETVEEIDNTKLNKSEISVGSIAPGAGTTGTYYFQY